MADQHITAAEYQAMQKRKSGGRYGVKASGGFRSRLEERIAHYLYTLILSEQIKGYKHEPVFTLPAKTPTGRQKTHKPDFEVNLLDGRNIYLEAKGYRHRDGETRRQWVEAEHGIEIHVVKSVAEAQVVITQHLSSNP